jgi:outer membrane protein OmpA-like peptidoglycan-associated protein
MLSIRRLSLLSSFLLVPLLAHAQPAETELPGVTAELLELRAGDGALRLLVRLNNTTAAEVESKRFMAQTIALVDTKTKRKYLPVKDASGLTTAGPFGDTLDGGRILAIMPPKRSVIVWAYFDPLPVGTTVNVEMPMMFPFENVAVTDGPSKLLAAKTAQSTSSGVTATLVSARRADQMVTVRLRLAPDASRAEPRFVTPYFIYDRVSLIDNAGKRKYPLMKDADGQFQAQPLTVKIDGGSFVPNWTQTILMTLTFQAPPDSVSAVDLFLPLFLPFVAVPLEGTGGAAAGGVETAGRSLGLEGALKDLNAKVTPAEITIDLSADVLFDFDKADVKKDAEAQLAKVATVIAATPGARVSIEGHTDAKGADAYNQSLSERRAAGVKDWLVANGQVSAAAVTTRGWGRTKPIAPNAKPDGSDDPEGRKSNRRVQIVVRKGA